MKCCAHAHALLPTGEVGGSNAHRANDREGYHPACTSPAFGRGRLGIPGQAAKLYPCAARGAEPLGFFAKGIATRMGRDAFSSGSVSCFCESSPARDFQRVRPKTNRKKNNLRNSRISSGRINSGMMVFAGIGKKPHIPFVFSSNGDGFVFHDRAARVWKKRPRFRSMPSCRPRTSGQNAAPGKDSVPDEEAVVLQDF